MLIQFLEPTSSKHIYIQQGSNTVHLLVPLEDVLQNQNTDLLREFLNVAAAKELTEYKDALVLDMALLDENHPLFQAKAYRLQQIEIYLKSLKAMKKSFENTIEYLFEYNAKFHLEQHPKLIYRGNEPYADFADIVDHNAVWHRNYFKGVQRDFFPRPDTLPPTNEWLVQQIEIAVDELSQRFLHHVARGKQQEAQALFTWIPSMTQDLLTAVGSFTDYSGRTFHCAAYEYAYWAKDTHMRRMLQSFMSEETKTFLLERIKGWGEQGLTFQREGQNYSSTGFDLSPLVTALEDYVNGYADLKAGWKYLELNAAWMRVGRAQRDLVQHLAAEYCRQDFLSLLPKHRTQDEHLPRDLGLYDRRVSGYNPWFPLPTAFSELGNQYAFFRAGQRQCMMKQRLGPDPSHLSIDLAAMVYLDELRTRERSDSLNFLAGCEASEEEQPSSYIRAWM